MADEYTPTTDVVLDAVTFPRRRLGEPRDMTEAAFSRWLAGPDAEIRAEALAPIRAALAGHPACDDGPDDNPVSCRWKRAVADVRRALDA